MSEAQSAPVFRYTNELSMALGMGRDSVWCGKGGIESGREAKAQRVSLMLKHMEQLRAEVLMVEVSSFLRANQAGIVSVFSGMKPTPAAHLRQCLAVVHLWPRVFLYH